MLKTRIICNVVPTLADEQPETAFGLGGTAFYADLPITAIWMEYAEPLSLEQGVEVLSDETGEWECVAGLRD